MPPLGLEGVTVKPTLFVVLVRKFRSDWLELLVEMVWSVGPLPLPNAVQVFVALQYLGVADVVLNSIAEAVHVPGSLAKFGGRNEVAFEKSIGIERAVIPAVLTRHCHALPCSVLGIGRVPAVSAAPVSVIGKLVPAM